MIAVDKTKQRIATRVYNLAIYPNSSKLEEARYTYERHLKLVNSWLGPLYFNGNETISTVGMGKLANSAQYRARCIIRALRAAEKITGNKTNVPLLERIGCPATIKKSKSSSFDYWLQVSSQFCNTPVEIPVKSHRKLNESLSDGWRLNSSGELFKDRNGKYYARVYVQKEVVSVTTRMDFLGVDVGYRHGACRSDGHIGTNTGRVIQRSREKRAQRQRQGLKVSGTKTRMKQLLDREAKQAIARCESRSLSLAIEAPKVVGNLCRGHLQGWSAAYLANRCHILGNERGVLVWEVNPWGTSQICSQCGYRDSKNRSRSLFVCLGCGYSAHADINAARNIASRAAVSIQRDALRNRKTKT